LNTHNETFNFKKGFVMKLGPEIIKEGFIIAKSFGISHTFERTIDLFKAKLEEMRKTNLYEKTKPQGFVTVNILGNMMKLDMNDYGIHRDLFLDRIREPIATEYVSKLLKPNDIVVDLGANIGYYVLLEAMRCEKVYAIEPVKQNVDLLKFNVGINGYKNVEIFSLAIGDKNCRAEMNISTNSNLHSFYPVDGCLDKIEVDMITLDDFLINKKRPTFVRMDIEGYELKVLRGMKNTLKSLKKLFIEIHAEIMNINETRELIDILLENEFLPELIVHYDRPKLSKILPNSHLKNIYKGDKGSYEVFFKKV